MSKLQTLEKEFRALYTYYISPNWDFSSIQLDGSYTAEDLREIADDLDKFNIRAHSDE
jgi:hypothetical protein